MNPARRRRRASTVSDPGVFSLHGHRSEGVDAEPSFPYFFRTGKKKAPGVSAKCLFSLPNLVGAIGLEPTTPTMSRWESGIFRDLLGRNFYRIK
jgi:hypothetical protein